MKHFKKVFAVLIVLVFAMTLFAGCGSTGTANATASETAASTAAAAEKAEAAAESAAAQTAAAESVLAEAEAAAAEMNFEPKNLNDGLKVAYIPISTAGITNKMFELALHDATGAYPNVSVDFFDPAYDVQTEITMFNSCIAEGYNLIICECGDPVALAAPVTEAEAAGIPVITQSIGTEAVHSLHVACDNYKAGYSVVESLVNDFGGDDGFKVCIMDTPAAMAANNQQSNGMLDAIEELTNWEVVAHQNIDNFSQEGANTAMRDILTANDDLDLILSCHDDLTAGILQALEASGRNDGSIILTGYMGNPMIFNAMMSDPNVLHMVPINDYYGEFFTAITTGLYLAQTGYTAVRAGLDKTPEILFTPIVTTAENVEEVYGATRWGWVTE